MPRPQHDSGDPSDATDRATTDRIADDLDQNADRVSDLPGDLSSDLVDLQSDVEAADEEVWFDPEALAAASQIDLGATSSARGLGQASLLDQLRARMASPGISLAELPSWPRGQGVQWDGSPTLGSALGELLGELRAGDLILVTGRGRGAGRTSLLAQLADALALRGSTAGQANSVLCLVEGPPVYWRARSLARWSGIDARQFLGSGGTDVTAHLERFAAGEWRDLDARQRFADASEWIDRLHEEQFSVVVIDPIEQLVANGEILDERLAALERLAGDRGFIVLASCDEPDPADARRIDRHVQARLGVSGSGEHLDIELCHCRLGPTKSVRLRWDRASGRIGG